MMHKQPHNDIMNPPGQIVNLEMPLVRAVEAFQGEQMMGLVRRVAELENALKTLREQNLSLYLKYQQMVASYNEVQKEYWKGT